MSSNKGFGVPKPLPGQPGFNKPKESVTLESETNEMAQRLQNLREQMMKEKEIRDEAVAQKVGGTKWRSARTDRSVRGYAKDVKDKYQQKVDAARLIPSSRTSKGELRAGATSSRFPPTAPSGKAAAAIALETSGSGGAAVGLHVESWGVSDVVSWLSDLGLAEHYKESFERNEINGPVLLEVGLDDLDYMEIRVLAHRKILLKGIEDLKKHGRPTLQLRASPSKPHAATASPSFSSSSFTTTTTSSRNSPNSAQADQPSSVPANAVHWSHAKPISENKVDPGNQPPVNLADGEYDEAAQAREFQAAVMAWRNGGASAATTNSGGCGASSSTSTSTSSSHAGQSASDFGYGVEGEQAASGGGGMWNNPFAADEMATTTPTTAASSSLLDGEYDEEAQQREFQQAVMAWRSGGSGGGAKAAAESSIASTSTTARPGSSSSSSTGGPAVATAEAVAEALAKQLDAANSEDAMRLQEKRREAEAALHEQRRELEEQREKLRSSHGLTPRPGAESKLSEEGEGKFSSESDSDDDYYLSMGGGSTEESKHKDSVGAPGPHSSRSDVGIAVVETTMGYTPRGSTRLADEKEDADDGGYVVVEEEDD